MPKQKSTSQKKPAGTAAPELTLYDHPNIKPQHSYACLLVAQGMTLQNAVKIAGTSFTDFYREKDKNEHLRESYARARLDQADVFADQIVEISDTDLDPQRAKNRIEARKWTAAKLRPDRYADIKNINLSGDIGLYPQLTDDQVYKRLSQVARKAGYVLLQRDDYERVKHLLPGPDGVIECQGINKDACDYKGIDSGADMTQDSGRLITQCVIDTQ